MRRIAILDSHTGGEPTRVVLEGGPPLGEGPLSERLDRFRAEYDAFRLAIVGEPRGSGPMVGALLVAPHEPGCAAGVIFFDRESFLGMCGHGTIGVVATLAHLGRIAPGAHRLDTPVGVVEVALGADGRVTLHNVPSYRRAAAVTIEVPGIGPVTGDVAWGGNWFFLVEGHGRRLALDNRAALTDYATRVRDALAASGITGAGGAEIDHVELFGPGAPGASARSFVLCPSGEYDRSPCGTGTSAKLACLAADGKLDPGARWVQESLVGSRFEARYEPLGDGTIRPTITGTAHVTLEGHLLIADDDPYAWGF